MNKSYLIAFIFAVAVAGWVISGQVGASNEKATAEDQASSEVAAAAQQEDPVTVRVRALDSQPRSREVVLRGRTSSVRSVQIRAEIAARVTKVLRAKGSYVKAGDVIAHLDMYDRAQRLKEAKALAHQRQLEYKAAKSLSQKGYRAETKLAAAMTLLDAANAQVKRTELEINHTRIKAPFAGIIDSRPVEVGDFLKVGEPVVVIVDQDPFLVVGEVSEREVVHLKVGQKTSAKLISGDVVHGKIRFIAATADAATRTFRVEVEVANPKRNLREGVTAEIRIPLPEVPAHFVSPAVMTLNDQGEIGVKTVDAENIVHFRPTVIVSDGENGVWLSGLPAHVNIIVVGQEFVRDGDRVVAVAETGPTS
jgi:multidrug efflux system membrane fusion protein